MEMAEKEFPVTHHCQVFTIARYLALPGNGSCSPPPITIPCPPMSYINAVFNHVRQVKYWADEHNGQANLNVQTFELEIKARHRYFTLYPQFLAEINGQRAHTTLVTDSVISFNGWLPYRPISWPLSSDKLAFKKRMHAMGLKTPAMWHRVEEATTDFIVKQPSGSFGKELAGPFRRGERPSAERLITSVKAGGTGTAFVEQFVQGTNVKTWFWGEHAVFMEMDAYPFVEGDGSRTISSLLNERLQRMGMAANEFQERAYVEQALAFQSLTLDSILPVAANAWLDYRYGRRFATENFRKNPDALPSLAPALRSQITHAGKALFQELMQEMNAPVLYSLDGVLDDQGRIWWLEMNSNPIFPPAGYRAMLSSLFGTPIAPRTTPPVAASVGVTQSLLPPGSTQALEKVVES